MAGERFFRESRNCFVLTKFNISGQKPTPKPITKP